MRLLPPLCLLVVAVSQPGAQDQTCSGCTLLDQECVHRLLSLTLVLKWESGVLYRLGLSSPDVTPF